MSNGNECACPVLETEIGINFHEGLTKREAFAMAAMQGILSTDKKQNPEEVAQWSVMYTDALLKELDE